MQRISSRIFLILAFTLGLHLQNNYVWAGSGSKFDKKLEKMIKEGDASGDTRVIIQTSDIGSLPGKLSKANAKNTKSLGSFPGMASELSLRAIQALAQDSAILSISSDELVEGQSLTGTEEIPTSSSGGLVARNRWSATGQGIGVAVIDSGIATHQDLRNDVYDYDFTTGTAKRSDNYGHGTHVAGIIGASGASSSGTYAGIAPDARLINLQVLDDKGKGRTSDVIAAIAWVINNRNTIAKDGKPLNIRVINLSLGHLPLESAATDPLAVACRMAVKAGVVVVASAGNYGHDDDGNTVFGGITTPGIERSVITVGAVSTYGTPSRADDAIAKYSSRGPTIDHILKPDISAPGSRVISTESKDNYLVTTDHDLHIDRVYMKLSGTSMAAPIIAGAAAMILSKVPALSPNAVKAILMYTAEKRGSPLEWGAGYVNIAGAMDLAMSVDPTAAANQYWLKPLTLLPSYEVINGYSATWGQTIVWGDSAYTGNSLLYNKSTWSQTIVWGDTIVWDETICWGETSVWLTSVLAETAKLNAQTIVWGDTIVWDETICWGDTIVWDEL
jgi:serine protease AprX